MVSDLRVSQACQLFDTSYQLYQHIKTNETIIRTVGSSLPDVLHTRSNCHANDIFLLDEGGGAQRTQALLRASTSAGGEMVRLKSGINSRLSTGSLTMPRN